ncbi:hypothetical protein FZC74_14320 [Sutcliffiella horikoshii]|uniref:Uncharacterized protein n=1 Tax=Sutcliffiella horikoshii TaxID=79883 RepID=A0AA94WRF2_9BACI|nr:hypothetical protein FZC74_14320 [Sutcliffiella horikoshii]
MFDKLEEGTGETPQAKAEEAHGPPVGKRSAWNGNQLDYHVYYTKKANGYARWLRTLHIS